MGWFVDVQSNCPVCGAHVPSAHPVGQPMVCPQCRTKLQVSVRYLQQQGGIATALALLASVAVGARGWSLLWWTLILWLPSVVALTQLTARYFPPKLEPWDGRKIA